MIDQEIGVDRLLIYENLETELDEVFKLLNIEQNPVELLNKIQTKIYTRKK